MILQVRLEAGLLNAAPPYLLFMRTLHSDVGCALYDNLQSGTFIENSFGEYLNEEELLLLFLDLRGCLLLGLHPSNVVWM